ncbi:hypothetical protein F0U61_44330 [Archangium violaceum]|uniref:DUF7919 family protein n=1 Tax=Archangium violaceum TaxID=83451 RepID=UPI002B2F6274|nr:hypothetical protein F0U61_44330 [Archangium violaceum]
MYFPDMGEQCQVGQGPEVRAVGWLDIEHPYTQGTVEPAFLEALQRHVKTAWAPVVAAGPHFCQFCREKPWGGAYNVWIPSERYLFIAPELIVHYITDHGYRPPDAFIEAVLACPAQHSPEYFEKLRPFRHLTEPSSPSFASKSKATRQ